jgi:hypothetical protein
MTGVWITLALGAIIIIFDWIGATKPAEDDKFKRRRPLSKQAGQSLRQLFIGTIVAAGAVWMIGQMFD